MAITLLSIVEYIGRRHKNIDNSIGKIVQLYCTCCILAAKVIALVALGPDYPINMINRDDPADGI